MNSQYETIIIGGGISGLACARRLHEEGRDFLLITKELGGRTLYDEKTGINLGAGIVLSNYTHFLKHVKKKPLSAKGHYFCDDVCVPASHAILKNLRDLPKMLKLLFLVWSFYRRFDRLRKKLPFESFREAMERDEELMKAFSTPAQEFVRKHKLEELNDKYINPIIASTFYVDYEKLNVFYYLGTLTPLLSKMYVPDFTSTVKQLTEGFEERILLEEAMKVTHSKELFRIKTSKRTLTSKYIVFAAPENSLKDIYRLPRPHIQQPVYRFIVRGKKKKEYRDRGAIIFNPKRHAILKISEEGEYDLVTSNKPEPDFERYYESHEIVRCVHWKPATIVPNKITEQDIGKNAYLASDYNLCSLEGSFLSGLYAANQIIAKNG